MLARAIAQRLSDVHAVQAKWQVTSAPFAPSPQKPNNDLSAASHPRARRRPVQGIERHASPRMNWSP